MMKKLSLLIALAMIVTIGGVYATWTYAGASAAQNHQHMSINLATASQDVAEGIIHEVENTLNIKLDDTNRDYHADPEITGEMVFVFVPSATGASADVLTNGIPMQWQLEQSATPMQYGGNPIFTINMDNPAAFANADVTKIDDSNFDTLKAAYPRLTADHKGGFMVKVTAAMVSPNLSVRLYLPTFQAYEDFRINSLSNGAVGITISKVTSGSGT